MGVIESKKANDVRQIKTVLNTYFKLTESEIYLSNLGNKKSVYVVNGCENVRIIQSVRSGLLGIRLNGHNIYEGSGLESKFYVMCDALPKPLIRLDRFMQGTPIHTGTVENTQTVSGDCYIVVKLSNDVQFYFNYKFHHKFVLEPSFNVINIKN